MLSVKSIVRSCFALLALLGAWGASAATLTVTSAADSGDGTLRTILASAADGDIIEIPEGMTVTLSTQIKLPQRTFTVRGLGSGATISGGGTSGLFLTDGGSGKTFLFENLVFEKAYRSGGGAGFVVDSWCNSTLIVNDCTVREMSIKRSSLQIGVFINGGNASFSFYSTNTVYTGLIGGAAVIGGTGGFARNLKLMGLADCRIVNNGTTELGKDSFTTIYTCSSGGETLIDRCVFSGNVSSNASPIAISASSGGKLDTYGYHFRDCQITNNLSQTSSGMFSLSYGRHIFENCRIADNVAAHNVVAITDGNGEGRGVEFRNCIIENNRTTATEYTNWSQMGLFFVRQSNHPEFPEVLLVTNTVIRNNYCREFGIVGCYSGGNLRFVDTLIENNTIWEVTLVHKGGVTNYFTRCAIVGNRQDPASTVGGSSGVFYSGRYKFDTCLIYNNNFPKSRYYCTRAYSGSTDLLNCTVVANVNSSGWQAFDVSAASSVIDTVIAGNVTSTGASVTDISWGAGAEPALTNCYFQTSSTPQAGKNVVRGKTTSDLRMDMQLVSDRSNTVFLDGSRMPYLEFRRNSPLRNTGLAHPPPAQLDIRSRLRDSKPDIGCWEYPSVGFAIMGRMTLE